MPPQTGKGGAPTPFSNAFTGPKVGSLRYNTSQYGSVVPVVYGCQRVTVNVIGMFGFEGASGSSKKGGGKGGGKSTKKGGGNYSVNVDFALCQGPVTFTGAPNGFLNGSTRENRVWSDGGVAGVNKTPVNYYDGNDGQSADSTFNGSGFTYNPGYSGTAHITGTPLHLGSTPALPNIQVEVTGFGVGTAGTDFPGDANPEFVVNDLLSNSRYGAGFPSANIDSTSFSDYANYCQAAGLAMSYLFDRQQPAARWVEDICRLTAAAPLWSPPLLKIIPYGVGSLAAHGATWTPNLTAQYTLSDGDFLDWSGSPFGGGSHQTDPVVTSRADPSRATNWLGVDFEDSVYAYNRETLPVFDQGAIDQFGLRQEPNTDATGITNTTSAQASGQVQLQRKLYVRNSFKFKLGWRFSLLEPMDIVDIVDPALGNFSCRITQIDEGDNGDLTVTAEELPGNGYLPVYNRDSASGVAPYDPFALPGDVNVPVIFEPPAALSGDQLQLWIIATGASASWGGCVIYVSTDNTTYAAIGTVYRGGRQGTLTANLPSHSDPDTTDTLSVDLTESAGQLLSGTQADADNDVTLCYCDGELVSYETATLTSAYHYNLTYLRRGAYGSTIGAHNTGSQFARIDPSAGLFKYTYPANFIGQTIYFKFASFNLLAQEVEDLSTLTAYPYTLTGAGINLPAYPVRGSQTGPTPASLEMGRFVVGATVMFPAAFSGSVGVAAVAATATANYAIEKNGVQVGTMSFAAGATVATFTSVASTDLLCAAGDVLALIAPASPDATLADLAWTLSGTQTATVAAAEFHGAQTGPTTANLEIARQIAVTALTLPAGLAGCYAKAGTAATGSTTYTLQQNGSGFGTMNFAAGASVATFSASFATAFAVGDVLTIEGPATPDATLADIGWVLSGIAALSNPPTVVSGSMDGPVTVDLPIARVVFDRAFSTPGGSSCVAAARVAGVGSTTFTIERNGVLIGSMSFAAGATTASFTMGTQAFLAGDILTIVAPASPDAALSGIAWAIAGTN